ncbi:MAG TPA: hypothetical protein VGE52_13050 [Pirellulales bacterium]
MYRSSLLLALAVTALVGCSGDDRPRRVPVTGKVTYNGKPVVGADVVFRNDKAPRSSYGKTDSDGKFVLTTYDDADGAIPGMHVVTIIKMANAPKPVTDLTSPEYASAMKQMQAAPKSEIPTKYSDPQSQAITKTVAPTGENHFDIDLTD